MKQYIKIEAKRLMSTLSGFLMSLLTVLLFAALLFVLAWNILPKALEVTPFRIGLCIEGSGENLISVYISKIVQQMESTKDLVEFEEISFQDIQEEQESNSQEMRGEREESGLDMQTRSDDGISRRRLRQLLEEKELTACIIIPERTVESIMNGDNIPIRVVMSGKADHAERYLQQRLLMLLTECGAALIDVPQAETLLLYELQVENPEELGKMLDLFHFGLVMEREDWFKKETVSVFGSTGMREYYSAAGLTLLMLFWGLGCGSFFERRQDSLPLLLKRRGISLFFQQGVRQGLYILWYLVPIFGLVIAGGIGRNRVEGMFLGMLLAAMFSLQSGFFFVLAPTAAGGMILNSVWGIVGFFGAGGILPTVFLPDFVTKVCEKLPAGICMELLLQNTGTGWNAGGGGGMLCLLWCLLFAAAGQCIYSREQ